uniref:Uncharacterized protein n=1 Tax=Romanomermis culicivorax TaxID=13658 RepID=A0A915HIE4_ROMCU
MSSLVLFPFNLSRKLLGFFQYTLL